MRYSLRTTALAGATSCAFALLAIMPLLSAASPVLPGTPPLAAQELETVVTLEGRGGYSLPISELDDRGAESDFGYGAGATLMLGPSFGLYGGWGRDIFRCDPCIGDSRIHASNLELGGKFVVPERERATPWLRAGVLASRSVLRAGTSRFESDRHVGFQAAVGLDAPIGEMVSVAPSVRFNSFTSEYDGLDGGLVDFEPETQFRYFSFDLALQVHLR